MNTPKKLKKWLKSYMNNQKNFLIRFNEMTFDMQAGILLKYIREQHGVLIYAYRNGSGYLWSMEMDDSGTDLGWSDLSGNHEHSGSFTSYDLALQDAIDLEMRFGCLEDFYKDKSTIGHWSHYSRHLQQIRLEYEMDKNK